MIPVANGGTNKTKTPAQKELGQMGMTPSECTLEALRSASEADLLEGIAQSDTVTTSYRTRAGHYADITANLTNNVSVETLCWLALELEEATTTIDRWQGMGLKCENELNTRRDVNERELNEALLDLNRVKTLLVKLGELNGEIKLQDAEHILESKLANDPYRHE